MEKDLLDISGEDEDHWLLKNTPSNGVTSFADGGNSGREKSSFDCSLLQIPRSSRAVPIRPPFSSIGRVTGNNNNMEQPSPCMDTGSVGKENASGSKVELPLCVLDRCLEQLILEIPHRSISLWHSIGHLLTQIQNLFSIVMK